MQRYRERQENRTLALPFEEEPDPISKVIEFPAAIELSSQAKEEEHTTRARPVRETRSHESSHAGSPQPRLEFHTGALQDEVWRLQPVAPLQLRVRGHLKDLSMIASGVVMFLMASPIIHFFGGAVVPNLVLLGGVLCGSLLLTLLYGLLFLWRSGATPGMRAVGLRVVSFEGTPASQRQRLWRTLAAVISAGSFLLGFLWAAVDEEKLYWHDHISKTYLTVVDR